MILALRSLILDISKIPGRQPKCLFWYVCTQLKTVKRDRMMGKGLVYNKNGSERGPADPADTPPIARSPMERIVDAVMSDGRRAGKFGDE